MPPNHTSNGARPKPIDRIPAALLPRLRASVEPDQIIEAAGHDLSPGGRYEEGVLILTADRVGTFARRDGNWDGEWIPIKDLSGALIVEGVGMGLLRLLSDGKRRAEFRYTLRHARDVSRLHRLLQKRIEGADPSPEDTVDRGDTGGKKVRCEKCGHVIPPWSEVCPACLSRRKVLSRLMDFVKPYRVQAIIGLVLAIASTLAGLIRPGLTRPMLDVGLGVGGQHAADYGVLLRYLGMVTALIVLSLFMDGWRERIMATLGSRMSRDIRDKTYAHLHTLSLSFFSRKPTGSLVARVTSDSDRIWDFVAFTIIELTISVLTVVGVGVALFMLDWRLACIVLLPVPLMFLFSFIIHRRLHSGFQRLFHRWSQMTAIVSDALPGVRVIKAFSREKDEVSRFTTFNADYYDDEVGMINLWTLFRPVMQFCTQIGTLLVWLVGGYWVVKGRMTPGTLVAYISYMWMFYGPIHMIAHMDRMFNRAATSVQRIFEILDTEPTIFSNPEARSAANLRGRIELRGVTFSYDGIRRVLQDVSLDIAPGEMIGLAGPSGGGKTTLVNLICRFYDAAEGRILVDGVDVRDYDVEDLRRHIGVVLQDPFLFHGTVADNIAYGKPKATREEIIAAARAANAHEFVVGFPDGYDTMVGERGHTLSGGERQRISIARAILHDPAVLILDEATSSVDTETEKLIQEALVRLISNRTTIAIAHRLSTLNRANRLVILDKGKVVELGTHAELRAKPDGVYAKLLRMQNEMQAIIGIGG